MAIQTIQVTDDEADIRLDRWFRRHYPGLTHSRLERLLRLGQIRVDGGRAKASTRLAPGQHLRIPPFGDAAVTPDSATRVVDRALLDRAKDLVIYRDSEVIALNKPPGLAVQGGTKVNQHIDALLDGLVFDARERPRLVHRLDKDTSGVLLLGRSVKATAHLAASFHGKVAQKTYWALVAGVPKQRSGRIDLAVAKQRRPRVGERVVPDPAGGKRAITEYDVLELASNRAAWLALRPLTGRTHQLRVHCAALGTPILGDGKYGGREAFIDGVPGTGSLKLHARTVVMPHPSGGMLEVTAGLPEPMRVTWQFFGFDAERSTDPFVGSK